ncbi:hypothetical protein E5288_WYG009395 [Bos mutus]|uniref:Transmembrane protein 230 n=1 Tax=Bos mutus TaxID=72004 RepID=A0A6B0R9K7_9CETA|nr:hypothetical protein [Bos mutus]
MTTLAVGRRHGQGDMLESLKDVMAESLTSAASYGLRHSCEPHRSAPTAATVKSHPRSSSMAYAFMTHRHSYSLASDGQGRQHQGQQLPKAPSCWQAISAKVGADRAVPVLIIGILVFLPGFYHLRITYYASKGYQGYSYDDIPDFDD